MERSNTQAWKEIVSSLKHGTLTTPDCEDGNQKQQKTSAKKWAENNAAKHSPKQDTMAEEQNQQS